MHGNHLYVHYANIPCEAVAPLFVRWIVIDPRYPLLLWTYGLVLLSLSIGLLALHQHLQLSDPL